MAPIIPPRLIRVTSITDGVSTYGRVFISGALNDALYRWLYFVVMLAGRSAPVRIRQLATKRLVLGR